MSHHDLILLISRYLDGQLDAEGRAAFNQALKEDPAVAAVFVAQARLHASLFRVSGDEPSADGLTTPQRVAALTGGRDGGQHAPKRRSARLHSRRSRRRRRQGVPLLLAAAVAAALLIGVLVTITRDASSGGGATVEALLARVIRVDGSAQIDGRPALVGSGVSEHARIATGDGWLGITLADGSQLLLGPHGDLRAGHLHPAALLTLKQGELQVVAAPRATDHPLRVQLPHATASVIGTRFHVRASPERSELRVEEGRVRFVGRGIDRILGPGEEAIVDAIDPNSSPESDPPPPVAIGFAGFTLLDIERNQAVPGFDPIPDGAVIDRAVLGLDAYTIIAQVHGSPKQLRFRIDGRSVGDPERNPPFAVGGNDPVVAGQAPVFYPLKLAPGDHWIDAEMEAADGSWTRARLQFTLR